MKNKEDIKIEQMRAYNHVKKVIQNKNNKPCHYNAIKNLIEIYYDRFSDYNDYQNLINFLKFSFNSKK